MIQRIQSVILLTAAICCILLFILPVFTWTSSINPSVYSLNACETVQITNGTAKQLYMNRPLITMNAIVIVMTIAVIFIYKNRRRQSKLCHLLLLLHLILVCLVMYDWDLAGQVAGEGYSWHIGSGMIFLILPLILFLIARHYIQKDEALVRSADRLR